MSNEDRYQTTGWDREQVRRQASSGSGGQHPRKRRRRNPIFRALVYLICVVVASILLAGIGWLLANDLCAFNKEYKEVTVEVTQEDTVHSVSKKLKDAGLIEYRWFFNLFAWISNADEKIGEGTYTLNTDMDYRALIVGMTGSSGGNLSAETVRVTIPEGYTVMQTINLLAENGVNTVEEFTDAAANYDFEYAFLDDSLKGSVTRLEGYLFPNTYDFYVGENAAHALSRLLDEFNRQMSDDVMALVEESGRSLQEIITIASLIEEETDGTDREKIASVIYNRLNNPSYETGGLLQIDASLVYATGHTELTEEDMTVDSPYNLYTHAGLPPTPITNPGFASIRAALQPAETSYYYYVLGNDGLHIFSETYAEHQQVINSLG